MTAPIILFLKSSIAGGAHSDLFAANVEVKGHTTKAGIYVAPHHSIRHKKLAAPAQADLFASPEPTAEPKGKPAKPQLDLFGATPEKRVEPAKEAPGASPFEWDVMTPEGLRQYVGSARSLTPAARDALRSELRAREQNPSLRTAGQVSWSGTGWVVYAGEQTIATDPATGEDWDRADATTYARRLQGGEPPATPRATAPIELSTDNPETTTPEPEKPTAGPETSPGKLASAVATEAAIKHWGVPAGTKKAVRKRLNAEAVKLLDAKSDDAMTPADKEVLAQYTGRGGVGDSINEFYTDPAVASSMWDMLRAAGFQGGDVLEPSSGTGVFLHTAPAGTHVTAVELDPTSARIASILHTPAGHEVRNASLERFATQDGRQFDAVVGNVPFGLRGSMLRDDKPDLATAEAYFVDTSLDKVRDGGLVALIVPTGFLDSSRGRAVRERIMCKGEFIGAHRLPNTAFEASHTEVTSDIVLFRKRPQEIAGALSTLTQDQLKAVGVWDADMLGGGYFTEGRGAGNIMGRMEEGWRAKAGLGQDITVTGSMHGIPEALSAWRPDEPAGSPTMAAIMDTLGDDPAAQRRAASAALKPAYQVAKLGDIQVVDGVRYILQGDPPRWHKAEEEVPSAVRDAQGIAELLDDLSEGRGPRAQQGLRRAELIERLDDYVKEHGLPHRNLPLRRWLAAPSLPMAANADASSEDAAHDHAQSVVDARNRIARLLGAVSDDGSYSDLVTGQTRKHDAAGLDTVATKLSLEQGGFTPEQLATAFGDGSSEHVLDHLFASPAYAVEPDGQTWSTMDSYLAGDLWAKYDAAKAAAAHAGLAPEYRAKYLAQVAALDEAIAPQSLEDVEIALNSGFITPETINAWFDARRDAWLAKNKTSNWKPGTATVTYDEGLYTVRQKGGYTADTDLIENFLNRSGVRKDDKEKLDRLNREFRDWLLGSDFRDVTEERYNRLYRGFRAPAYSDAPIAIPGLNPALDVNGYHFAGLRWAMAAGKGIVAADVGLGKTGRGLMLAKLAKSTGQATKPTFVVPKSVLANWLKEAEFWFPGSRVLTIGETYATDKKGNVTSKADDEATRRRKFHELQQNDYDFVFISQPAWNDLDVDPITKGQYANDDFWAKRGDKLGNAGDKRLNQIRTAHDQALAKREFAKREDTLHFGDLGIDMLLLDEGHAFKNLYAAKNRFGESPKFLGGSGLSNRAQDTYFKTRKLRERNGGKGVFMLTATPTKNSPLEVYSMLAHIAPEAFERMGIKNSEDFLDRFCEFKLDNILNTRGDIEEALVTAGFKNLSELREVMRRYIDRKTAEDVGLALPERNDQQHLVDMTPEQEAVYAELRAQAKAAASGDDTGDAHIFSVMSRMGKASLDLSLLDPKHAGAVSPKIETLAENAAKGTLDGGQVIFCDHNDAHEKIADAMVRQGIPRAQIGIINAKVAASSASRQKISDDFNAGKLVAVIGNTATMGEGINLQKRTTDIHHLDLPWEPASVQQRNGRGLRQGNTKKGVRLHTYLAKGSFDGYRWQTVAAKKDWQDLLWNGGDRVENLAREGGFSRDDMLIMLSADPDAARTKYVADKAAAEQRKQAEEGGRAAEVFVKFQEMKANARKLRAKAAEKGEAEDSTTLMRMEQKADRLRALLRDNRYFPHKDLLDGDKPAVIEPVTGHAWTEGRAFELAGGSGGPVYFSDKPSKWVVTGVDPQAGTVSARPFGTVATHPIDLDLAKMKAGVTPFDYSKEAEDAALAEEKTRLAAQTVAKLKTADHLKFEDVKAMPREAVEGNENDIQRRLKQSMMSYNDRHDGHYGMVDMSTGKPEVVQSWGARKKMDSHDLILPTAKGRQQAIDGHVAMALGRTIQSRMSEPRRGNHKTSVVGTKAVYPGFEYDSRSAGSNPWDGAMEGLFPDHHAMKAEAKAELHRRVTRNIADAPTFRDAVMASSPALDVQPYGGPQTWSKEIVATLADKAKAAGVLDRRIADVAAPARSNYHSDLHPSLFQNGGRDYATYWTGTPENSGTVRQWLSALPGGQEAIGEVPAEAA